MTAFLDWWVETDRLLEARGLPKLDYVTAHDFHECGIEPEAAVAFTAAFAKWADQRLSEKQ